MFIMDSMHGPMGDPVINDFEWGSLLKSARADLDHGLFVLEF